MLRCVGSVNEMQLMFRDASLTILQEAQVGKSIPGLPCVRQA